MRIFLLNIGFVILFFLSTVASAKIRLHKVKPAALTCTNMKIESSLSRADKKIYGTEKTSVILKDDISVVGDLGKKVCQWPLEKFSQFGEVNKLSFYIDEYKNILVPYAKNENSYRSVKISLDNCSFEDEKTLTELNFPKCDPPTKKSKKRKSRKKTA